MDMSSAIIAGEGALPEVIAERLAAGGESPVVYALRADASAFSKSASDVVQVKGPEFKAAIGDMMRRGVRRVYFAGAVPKALIYETASHDEMARSLLAGLASRDDHSLLGGIVSLFEMAGFEVASYKELIGDLIAGEGHIAGREATPAESEDIAYGIDVARAVVPLSFGQSVIVKGRSVVAVEAMEGTDAAIERAGSITKGGVLVKMMKHGQDVRFDLPTVGTRTLELMSKAGLTALAIHAGCTLMLSKDEFMRRADELGITICGFKE